jgi:glyoxylase-like metal-dependent hydrolase (beta-lactamase superfamily II)
MVTELAEGVWWIDLPSVNAYLVDDGGVLTLVDAGTPWDAARIIHGIQEAGFSTADVERVLVTHYDLDHVGALGDLAFPDDVEVYAGTADAPFVTGQAKPPARNHKGLFQRVTGAFTPSFPGVAPIEDGATVGSFTVYHTPGHTPGHTAFVSETLSAAFLGDLVRESGGRLKPSPWIISYDTGEVRRSIQRLAGEGLAFEVAAMGHGTPFQTGGDERLAELAARP